MLHSVFVIIFRIKLYHNGRSTLDRMAIYPPKNKIQDFPLGDLLPNQEGIKIGDDCPTMCPACPSPLQKIIGTDQDCRSWLGDGDDRPAMDDYPADICAISPVAFLLV